MPLFALICQDKPGALDVRLANRPAHLDWLAGCGAVLAGPFLNDGQPDGSLVVIEAPDMAAAQAVAAQDPYAVAGLFSDVMVREWKRVIG